MQYTFPPSEKEGVNVPDESALHWVHVLIPAIIQNKSPTCLFYKIVIVVEAPVNESVSHKLLFICQKHICWVKFSNIFSTPHLIVLAREHCSEHDPVILSVSLSLSLSLYGALRL